jgi:glycosyltransferase involved in cell wall biosynthesis
MKPLVSILMPAYNAERWISHSLESAIAQTWSRKEIIVANDGSTDRTEEVAQRFASKGVRVVTTKNEGLSGAVNNAYRYSQGDYLQYLDSDDLLAPDKIERQLAALRQDDGKRVLLSSPMACFYYRHKRARFIQNSLCQDLSPVEWLIRKMRDNLHMQNATWLVSRELAEGAGPWWDKDLNYDQDGEYFTRVLVASEGVRFVPGTGIFYRSVGTNRVSYIGNSDKKKEGLIRSMKLHVQYLRSLEDSERVREACLVYMQRWSQYFYPERPDLFAELQAFAAELHSRLEIPRLRWKYAWIRPLFGWKAAKRAQAAFPRLKESWVRNWDKKMYELEERRNLRHAPVHTITAAS